jgi:hypothetical protein
MSLAIKNGFGVVWFSVLISVVGAILIVAVVLENREVPAPVAPDEPAAVSIMDTDAVRSNPEITRTNTQVQNDTLYYAAAVMDFMAFNNGQIPRSNADVARVLSEYVDEPRLNPLTNDPYILSIGNEPAPGILSLSAGVKCAENGELVPGTSSRSVVIRTTLADLSTYCVEL